MEDVQDYTDKHTAYSTDLTHLNPICVEIRWLKEYQITITTRLNY